MIEIENQTSLEFSEALVRKIAAHLSKKDIELLVVNSAQMQEINKRYRDIDKDTDVLSFPMQSMPKAALGSIVISADLVAQKALELGHSTDDEFALLFIHGMLHLLGYDHEVDNGEMRQKEEELVLKFKLPDSLIVRS